MTVVETVRFLKDVDALMAESDRARLVEFIAPIQKRRSDSGDRRGQENCDGLFRDAANEEVRE